MWAVLLMAAAAAGLLATEGRTPLQIEAVAAALLAVDDLNAAYASDNITFTLAAAWGDYDVDVVDVKGMTVLESDSEGCRKQGTGLDEADSVRVSSGTL